MKYIKLITLFVLSLLFSCNSNFHNVNIDSKSKSILKESYMIIGAKGGGVTFDYDNPIYHDTIIILNNKLSKKCKFKNIKKKIFLDSASLCKLVIKKDSSWKGVQPFLLVKKEDSIIKKYAVYWGAQYINGVRCTEIERRVLK